ncbi:hypothetical protein BGZ80_002542 [Entomortierella chlamydospora]|uniref:F-box domain-containing protein n=1 Tax=Entomortierella chlamydospora TaxID=101097 RepID=A0A9P6N161_9FUNG|nr:hypothetical protein BGZ80_002542 [Entomortierella chlamydospora]
MLDIPELDDMICQRLERRQLAQCSRVNKQWHRIVTPYLWRDVSSIYGYYQRAAFRSMVLEDYHIQNLQSQDPNGNMNPSCRLPLLSKYSPLIRKIPSLDGLMEYLQPPNKSIRQPSQELENAQDNGLTVHDLYILSRCSSKLKKLTFRGVVTNVEDEGPEEDEEEEEREPIIRLKHKELILSRYREWDDSTEFWRWLWKRCGRVEILRVYDTGEAVESLADGILNNMPNLREIHLGRSDQYHMDLTDGDIATLLSSCLYGWRVVEIKHTANFREASKAALFKLFPTLEVLILGNDDLKNEDLVLLLSSAPKLQELVTLDDGYYRHRNPTSIRADLLIDLDPDKTNTLRTWPCEESLKVLKVVISGIGRADLEKQRRYEITKENSMIMLRIINWTA